MPLNACRKLARRWPRHLAKNRQGPLGGISSFEPRMAWIGRRAISVREILAPCLVFGGVTGAAQALQVPRFARLPRLTREDIPNNPRENIMSKDSKPTKKGTVSKDSKPTEKGAV